MPFDSVNFVLPAVETDTILRVLIRGRELVANPADWLQGPASRTLPDGRKQRCSHCALRNAATELGIHDKDVFYIEHYRNLSASSPIGSAIDFNDDPNTTHADMLAMWDRAIAARRGELS